MAKPRVFISSTYYDLKLVRHSIEQFVGSMGYDSTVFESGDIPFTHTSPADESCYREIALCHMLVLIIGSRYGTAASSAVVPQAETEADKFYAHYNSITKLEYETARAQDIPIYIFVEKGVLGEYETFKKNREMRVNYAVVQSVNIFLLLDEIFSQNRNNFVKEFSNADDITNWLRDQWAGLFAHQLSERRDQATVGQLKLQIESLSAVVSALKSYTEEIVKSVNQTGSAQLIERVQQELTTKQHEAAIRSIEPLRHMMDDHGYTTDYIIIGLKASSNLEDFLIYLKGSSRCTLATDYFLNNDEARYELDNLRVGLGLSPWKKRKTRLHLTMEKTLGGASDTDLD